MTAPAARLDWRRHAVGALKPCRICGTTALLRDQNGDPCHKGCAENEIDRTAARAVRRRTTR